MPVELIDHMGNDLRIVDAARVSYGKQSRVMDPQAQGILRSMLVNGHGSPFEHVLFTFRVHVPIGVAREWFRHRIGSFNEISTRYVEMESDFYLPESALVRKQVGKAMRYTFEPASAEEASETRLEMDAAYAAAYRSYQRLLDAGIAKELARNVLPLGLMTQFMWTVNLRSLFNFLMLRNAPQALAEIRQEAAAVEDLIRNVVPYTMTYWYDAGRPKV